MDDEPKAPPVGGGYAKYVLVVLVFVYVFNFIDRQILSILAEDIKADLGISDADIGFLYGTAFAVFYAVFGIPLGKLADVWNRRSLISIGLGFWSLMTALSGTARNFTMLASFRFGVGVGEASASPAAFSMLSDYFPPSMRATVMAIYGSGIYIGSGIGLFLGGLIVDSWNGWYPDPSSAPLGLKGWQAAFVAVGMPGVLMALWVWTLREPVRGQSEGITVAVEPHPFRVALASLASVLPPLTIFSLAHHGGARAVLFNLGWAVAISGVCYGAHLFTETPSQWIALGIGLYATVSWIQGQQISDPAAYAMMFHCRTFVLAILGFSTMAFVTYGVGFWSPPLMLRVHNVTLAEAGAVLGLGSAVGGWLGITVGGVLADWLRRYTVNARLYVGIAVPLLATPFALGFVYAPTPLIAYVCSFLFSIFSPMWIGAAVSTVNDLMMPRMRATASAFYILTVTFVGLAMGPYLIGQISSSFQLAGISDGLALQTAMAWGCGMFGVSLLFLLPALRVLATDESSRIERARAYGEPV